jgi:hypothetical protein
MSDSEDDPLEASSQYTGSRFLKRRKNLAAQVPRKVQRQYTVSELGSLRDNFLCSEDGCSNRSRYILSIRESKLSKRNNNPITIVIEEEKYLCGVHIPKKDRRNVMLIEEKIAKSIKPTKTIDKMCLYERKLCNLLFHPEFLNGKECELLYDTLESLYPEKMKDNRRRALVFGDPDISYNVSYTRKYSGVGGGGSPGSSYPLEASSQYTDLRLLKRRKNLPAQVPREVQSQYTGSELGPLRDESGYLSNSKRATNDWSQISILKQIKKKIEILTKFLFPDREYNYNVVLIQRYPSGQIPILPHRDKEIGKDQLIVGISVGAERILELSPPERIKEDNIYVKLIQGSLYAFLPPTNSHWRHSILKDHTQSPRYSLTFRTY